MRWLPWFHLSDLSGQGVAEPEHYSMLAVGFGKLREAQRQR
jgi:hypothetical protein